MQERRRCSYEPDRSSSRPARAVNPAVSNKSDERIDSLRAELAKSVTPFLVEVALSKVGVLQDLEEIGLVPVLENPNPFDIDTDEAAHENWWENHPAEAEQFERAYHLRERVLNAIYAGTVLGNFLRSPILPKDSGREIAGGGPTTSREAK